jgi:hypothetical protein
MLAPLARILDEAAPHLVGIPAARIFDRVRIPLTAMRVAGRVGAQHLGRAGIRQLARIPHAILLRFRSIRRRGELVWPVAFD